VPNFFSVFAPPADNEPRGSTPSEWVNGWEYPNLVPLAAASPVIGSAVTAGADCIAQGGSAHRPKRTAVTHLRRQCRDAGSKLTRGSDAALTVALGRGPQRNIHVRVCSPEAGSFVSWHSVQWCQNSANKMMIGIGTSSSQSRTPLPKPMRHSFVFLLLETLASSWDAVSNSSATAPFH
jgi:hypothetical protein